VVVHCSSGRGYPDSVYYFLPSKEKKIIGTRPVIALATRAES
jgi:hypothetical protein